MFSQGGVEPAPLDRAALEQSLRPFGESRMLPREAYVDPAVFAWEQRHFFADGWTCVGRGEDIAVPGDQRAESVGDAGVLLTRADDGVVRAFANACRHRGHELLACGTSANHVRVICPYHAWSYDLRGALRAAAGFKGRDGFDADAHGLVELPAEEWHGLVFVDASGRAEPLAAQLATLDALFAPYEPERLRVAGRHEYEVASNWKILTENYHECYHCPMIHPQLCDVSPPRSGENYRPDDGAWIGGWMELRDGMATMSLDGRSGATTLRGLTGDALRQVVYVNIFPNVLVSLHPDYVMTHRLTPLATDRTRIECTWAFAPESVEAPGFDPSFAVDFWDLTNQQDWHACESVQRGLSSDHAVPGPLSAEEDAVYQYVTMIARGYLGQPVRNSPMPARTHSR
ncbi:MAG TPA: aromatic ring-hydroxylating dioxygenase subunit alpha [Acidimicrobiales bacterium]|nr:aromatic ring-hydroxylating dioxygenase subunit alpha [Acidimicrobiales bacterium]